MEKYCVTHDIVKNNLGCTFLAIFQQLSKNLIELLFFNAIAITKGPQGRLKVGMKTKKNWHNRSFNIFVLGIIGVHPVQFLVLDFGLCSDGINL